MWCWTLNRYFFVESFDKLFYINVMNILFAGWRIYWWRTWNSLLVFPARSFILWRKKALTKLAFAMQSLLWSRYRLFFRNNKSWCNIVITSYFLFYVCFVLCVNLYLNKLFLLREYRDLTINAAVTQCYRDMGARHRARAHSIQIIRVEAIDASECRRPLIKQMHDPNIKFPLPRRQIFYNFYKKGWGCFSNLPIWRCNKS